LFKEAELSSSSDDENYRISCIYDGISSTSNKFHSNMNSIKRKLLKFKCLKTLAQKSALFDS